MSVPGAPNLRARRRPRRRMGTRAKVLFASLAGLLVFGAGWSLIKHRAPVISPKKIVPAIVAHLGLPPVSVLVLGRQSEKLTPLTDSMMLVAVDPKTHHMGMLSIPRDLWVNIPGHGYARINEAYMFGGDKLVARVVDQVTGIEPDYVLLINYAGFTKLINDVGGVTVDVKQTINDPTYPAPDECCGNYSPLYIPAGVHHMKGSEALAFMRERHDLPDGDLSREADQQEVLLALKNQVLRPGNVLHLPTLLSDLAGTFKTDFPLSKVPAYAAAVASVPRSKIHHAVLNFANQSVGGWTTPGGADVLLPHDGNIGTVVQRIFGGILGKIGTPTAVVDPRSLAPQTAPQTTSQTATKSPSSASGGLSFAVVPGGNGTTWHAALLPGAPALARLQALIALRKPAKAGTPATAIQPLVIGFGGGGVERVQPAQQPGVVLIGRKPYADPQLALSFQDVERQAPYVVSLAVGGKSQPGAVLSVRGAGWVGPRVTVTLAPLAAKSPKPITLGTAKVVGGDFTWSGHLPAKLAPGMYRLQGGDGVRSMTLELHVGAAAAILKSGTPGASGGTGAVAKPQAALRTG